MFYFVGCVFRHSKLIGAELMFLSSEGYHDFNWASPICHSDSILRVKLNGSSGTFGLLLRKVSKCSSHANVKMNYR